MKLKSQKGEVALLTIILGVFTICGLITTSANLGMQVHESGEMKKLAGMIVDNANTLRRNHQDDPIAVAQADAWVNMAEAIKRTNNFATIKKMTGEMMAAGANFIPGQLPFAKGTREAIEMGKNVYDTITGLNSAYGKQPKKPSKEMKDFLKAITQGKISPDALEIAMMKVRAQALNRQIDDLSAELQAQEAWQEKQKNLLDNYSRLFVTNSLKSAREQLEENGKLSSYYKKLFEEDRFKKQLGSYPQITEALKNTDELEPVAEEEKEAIDETAMEVVEESKELQEALGEVALDDLGDWQKSVLQTLAKAMEIPVQEDETYQQKIQKCKTERDRIVSEKQRKQKEDSECSKSCGPAMINGAINQAGLECINNCMSKMDITAGVDETMADYDYEECVNEAKKSL